MCIRDRLKAVKYASSLHKMSRIVSNAYWAKNYKTAYCMLRKYKESGLCEINYSTGDSHQEYVPYDNIVFACRAALDLSLSTGVNVETHECKKFHTKTLQSDVRLLKYETRKNFWIKSGLWIPIDSSCDVRVCGIGGVCGFIGRFYNKKIGYYTSYVGDYSQAFLVKKCNGRKYVFSCEDRDNFLSVLKNKLMNEKH